MTTKEKQKAVWVARDFMEAVATIVAATENEQESIVAEFPQKNGLGTDGTCWTDAQHREFFLAIIAKAKEFLKPKRRKPA